MKLVTRAQLGWPASAAPLQATAQGTKVHYEGSPVSTRLLTDHDACIAEWKAIRASHLANVVEDYSDIAYNYGACPHGFLLEGRGLGRRTGANGNQTLNIAHYAVCGLVGDSGLTEPTDAMLSAIRDGIDLLRQHGAGDEIRGHRDGYATTCPGAPLYAWVQQGAPRPTDATEDDMPLTDDEITRIAKAAAKEVRWLLVDDPFKIGDAQTTLGGLWWETASRVAKLPTQPAAPQLSDTQLAALADRIAASPALAEAVAARVDAKLAARLQS